MITYEEKSTPTYLKNQQHADKLFKFQMVVFELESGPPACEFDYLSFETKDKGKFSRAF